MPVGKKSKRKSTAEGRSILKAMREVLAHTRGEKSGVRIVHPKAPKVDVAAVRAKT